MKRSFVDPRQHYLEEALLRVGREVRMSPEVRDKVLASLAATTVGMTAASAAKAGALGWLSTKGGGLVAVGLAGAIGVTGAVVVSGGWSEDAPENASSTVQAKNDVASSAKKQPSADTRPVGPVEPPARPRTSEKDTSVASSKQRSAKRPSSVATRPPPEEPSALRRELSHVARIEGALEAGNPTEALSHVSEYRRRFARPQLGLEAEVLTIQALYESGSVAAARKRAARFLERYPKSPLSVRARRYLE